jgi:hypothetical protein
MTNQDKQQRKTTYDKPVTLHPLTFVEALKGLLQTKPMPKEEKTKKKRTKKESSS